MAVELSEEVIQRRLREALLAASLSSDGYAEIELTDETRLKCAAVLVPLLWQDDQWSLLFTRRTDHVESHKGQVSFPGGGCDEGEITPEETALREAQEEIGLEPQRVRILGRLPNMITITSFHVTPVVGVIEWPAVFIVGQHEVARVFTIPLYWLADTRNRWEFPIPERNRSLIAFHPYDGELLWGATARMTVDFLKVLGLA
ncbi:MAG TPA: CoA pyrophosphatase [Anaerolineales bacterium]|nr:CoA pyrophosphatase [Anaerolineales bacterium]